MKQSEVPKKQPEKEGSHIVALKEDFFRLLISWGVDAPMYECILLDAIGRMNKRRGRSANSENTQD